METRMKKRVIMAALMMGMVIAACGSGKDSANAATVLETHAQAKTAASQEEEMVGAFCANQGSFSPADNQDAMKVFNAAVEGKTGYQYEVLAVLGSQVVAGTNYAYLCRERSYIRAQVPPICL